MLRDDKKELFESQTSSCGPDNCCQFGFATAQVQNSQSLGPRFHELATQRRSTSHCGVSRGVGSSKVCITKHLNVVIQLGPWISAGHSRVFDCVPWYLIVYRATLLTAVRSCVRGEAIFRINFFTECKRSGHGKEIESRHYTLEQQLQILSLRGEHLLTFLGRHLRGDSSGQGGTRACESRGRLHSHSLREDKSLEPASDPQRVMHWRGSRAF